MIQELFVHHLMKGILKHQPIEEKQLAFETGGIELGVRHTFSASASDSFWNEAAKSAMVYDRVFVVVVTFVVSCR